MGIKKRETKTRGRSKKDEVVTMRLTSALKDVLEKSAQTNNRTLSQEMEYRLINSCDVRAVSLGELPENVQAIGSVVSLMAHAAQKLCGSSWDKDRFTHELLSNGIRAILEHHAPLNVLSVPKQLQDEITKNIAPEDIVRSSGDFFARIVMSSSSTIHQMLAPNFESALTTIAAVTDARNKEIIRKGPF